MIPSFRRINVKDKDLRLVQDSVDKVFNVLLEKDILDGRLIKNIGLSSTPVSIDHKLGREVSGWILVRNSADARVWDDQASNTLPSTSLILVASAITVVSIWVF